MIRKIHNVTLQLGETKEITLHDEKMIVEPFLNYGGCNLCLGDAPRMESRSICNELRAQVGPCSSCTRTDKNDVGFRRKAQENG